MAVWPYGAIDAIRRESWDSGGVTNKESPARKYKNVYFDLIPRCFVEPRSRYCLNCLVTVWPLARMNLLRTRSRVVFLKPERRRTAARNVYVFVQSRPYWLPRVAPHAGTCLSPSRPWTAYGSLWNHSRIISRSFLDHFIIYGELWYHAGGHFGCVLGYFSERLESVVLRMSGSLSSRCWSNFKNHSVIIMTSSGIHFEIILKVFLSDGAVQSFWQRIIRNTIPICCSKVGMPMRMHARNPNPQNENVLPCPKRCGIVSQMIQ